MAIAALVTIVDLFVGYGDLCLPVSGALKRPPTSNSNDNQTRTPFLRKLQRPVCKCFALHSASSSFPANCLSLRSCAKYSERHLIILKSSTNGVGRQHFSFFIAKVHCLLFGSILNYFFTDKDDDDVLSSVAWIAKCSDLCCSFIGFLMRVSLVSGD